MAREAHCTSNATGRSQPQKTACKSRSKVFGPLLRIEECWQTAASDPRISRGGTRVAPLSPVNWCGAAGRASALGTGRIRRQLAQQRDRQLRGRPDLERRPSNKAHLRTSHSKLSRRLSCPLALQTPLSRPQSFCSDFGRLSPVLRRRIA